MTPVFAQILIAAALLTPLLFILSAGWKPWRDQLSYLLVFAPVPGLFAAIFSRDGSEVGIGQAPGRLSFQLDEPGAILLGVTALLWMGAGIYAASSLRKQTHCVRFSISWLLSMSGSFGVFLAADLAGFLLAFTVASLPAYGLIIHDGTPAAKRAGSITLGLALLGETCLLLAFVLLTANHANINILFIQEAVQSLPGSPWRDATIFLLFAGFAIKVGLVPVHFWLPLAHSAAPAAGSAVLSGILIKIGIMGLIRFLPLEIPQPGWPTVLLAAGFGTAFFAAAVGLTQKAPKAILAYSSVSQMGFITALLGAGWAAGNATLPTIAAFYAAHHVLAKGALFLAVGVAGSLNPRQFAFVLFWPAAVVAMGFAGLPLSGGAAAKLVADGLMNQGAVALCSTASAAASAMLMVHFLYHLPRPDSGKSAKPASSLQILVWQALAAASILVPWILYETLALGPLTAVFSPDNLIKLLGPIISGGALAWMLQRRKKGLPAIPNGDIANLGSHFLHPILVAGNLVEQANSGLRRWPVACAALLIGLLLLAAGLINRP